MDPWKKEEEEEEEEEEGGGETMQSQKGKYGMRRQMGWLASSISENKMIVIMIR